MANAAIEAKELRYSYGDFEAVSGISFRVDEGEILGFLGPNGAGKTTTVKMLTGQLAPKSGEASILGIDVGKDPEAAQAEIGVCFEQTNLYEKMTAVANLKLFAKLFGVKNFDAYELLKRVGLAGKEKNRVATYSKGMKQRLMVARSMVSSPKVLFLDEPTAGLDPNSAQAIRRLIMEERNRGATIFLTTHDMMEADKLSDRVAFMNQGAIVALETPHYLKQQHGKRAIVAQVSGEGNDLESREIEMDTPQTADAVRELFSGGKVITIHSEEATLEDIFILLTGRGLEG